jgi:hypothetical protein
MPATAAASCSRGTREQERTSDRRGRYPARFADEPPTTFRLPIGLVAEPLDRLGERPRAQVQCDRHEAVLQVEQQARLDVLVIAHWQGFCRGPRDGERQFELRWLPPIAVNVSEAGELSAVIRPVQ